MVSSKVVSKAKSSILNPQYLKMPFSPLTELKFVSAATTPSNPLVGSGIESLLSFGSDTLFTKGSNI